MTGTTTKPPFVARRAWPIAALSVVVLVMLGLTLSGTRQWFSRDVRAQQSVRMIQAHGESVPDLAEHVTVASLKNGLWSDPSTWDGGRVPGERDTVRISERTTVVYDLVSDARLRAVGVAGTLRFDASADTRLRVTHILVYRGGTLAVGDDQHPMDATARAEIVFNDEPLETGTESKPGIDPFQYGNGLLVWGTLTLHGAERAPAFARLRSDATRGATVLTLESEPRGWRVGDRLFLPDSRRIMDDEIQQVDRSPYNLEGSRGVIVRPEWEVVEIGAIEGARVTLTQPLANTHPAARDASGRIESAAGGAPMAPHVANLSRNVTLRSENPDGVRGHMICFRDATVDVVNASFRGMGRTTAAVLDGTQRDESGRLVHIGTNQLARYPIHMHHLVDPSHVGSSGYAFTLRGNVVEGGRRWGISIHGSHYGLIQDNVVVDIDGAGIVTEDGSESGNRFEHNLVGAIRGSGQEVDARRARDGIGHEGAGFWLGSDNNIVVGNVAAGVRDGGFTLFRTPEAVPFPVFPERATTAGQPVRAFEFSGNEVYGAAETGVELWDSKECKFCKGSEPVLRDTTVWHSRAGIRYDYHADFYRIDGLDVYGDARSVSGTTGVLANYSRRAALSRADIRYVEVGIDCGGSRNRVVDVADVSVRATVPLRIHRGTAWDDTGAARFRDVSLVSLQGAAGKLVELDPGTYGKGTAKIAVHRPITFVNFQRRIGATFQLFYRDQAPGHQMPQNEDPVLGCPDAGLTNAECFTRHGVSIGGEPAPCDTVMPGIDGFTCSPTTGTSPNY